LTNGFVYEKYIFETIRVFIKWS